MMMIIFEQSLGFFPTFHPGPFATFHESICYSLDCGSERRGRSEQEQVRDEHKVKWWHMICTTYITHSNNKIKQD